jgi:peptide/nickel transport system substrate-binding protein
MRTRSIALLLSIFLPGCAGETGTSAGGDIGGTMVILAPVAADPLMHTLITDITSREIADNLYETLAEIGPAMNTVGDAGFQPRLARSWQWAADSQSIAFAIDPSAKWHDGRPVRASDVRFSLEVLKDPQVISPHAETVANIDSISVRDSLTAVAWFNRRTPEQFYDLAYQLWILPEHVLKDIPRNQLGTSDAARRPIGSGPFKFVRWDPGVRVEIVADTSYHLGRPRLDRIIWSFVPDGSAAITQLFSGQGDYYESFPVDLLPRVDSSAQLKAFRYPALQYTFLGFNARDPKRLTAPHPIFSDVTVRRAISMALDREAMLRNVFDTLGVLGAGPFPSAKRDTSLKLLPLDRARAAAMLDSVGWSMGADSVRSKNGRPLAFSIMVPNSSRPRMRYAVLIQEQLKGLGARVNIDAMAFPEFLARQSAKNFDAATMTVGVDPSPKGVRQNWGSAGINGGQNHVSYSSRTFDALADSAENAFDPAKSREYYRRAYATIVADAPAVWLYDPLYIAGAHTRIRPANMRADAWWAGLPDFWIPANERIERDRIGLQPAQP